jgi:anti-sigma-K factor RskA
VRAAALIWQSRLASLNELQPQAQPSNAVWTRIDNLVQGEKTSAAQQAVREQAQSEAHQSAKPLAGMAAWLRSLTVWRTASAAGALATVVAITVGSGMRQELGTEIARLQTQLQAAPQIQYVAVLADDKSTASMLVTFDAKAQKLTLQRVGDYHEAGDRSLQLWALPPAGGPKSLGVLGADKLLRLTANEAAVREVPTLAISLEPKGGVPSETGPTGPVLFKGALIQKML